MEQKILDECWSKIGPQQNRTKCPYHRVRNLFNHCSNYIDNNINGDFVEIGVWKGARLAIDDFRKKRGITAAIQQTPADDFSKQPSLLVGTEHFWIKE